MRAQVKGDLWCDAQVKALRGAGERQDVRQEWYRSRYELFELAEDYERQARREDAEAHARASDS